MLWLANYYLHQGFEYTRPEKNAHKNAHKKGGLVFLLGFLGFYEQFSGFFF